MYPYFRMIKLLAIARKRPKMEITDKSVLKLRVWPGDIDIFKELNNGRHLTLMDFGRFEIAARNGLLNLAKKKGWGFAVAGASIRYRHRLHLFDKFELHTRVAGFDKRWFYFHQEIIRKGKIHSSALVRTVVTSKTGIVNINDVIKEMGLDIDIQPLPAWAKAWSDAEEMRPWDNPRKQERKNAKPK